jgi:hypothetical protein
LEVAKASEAEAVIKLRHQRVALPVTKAERERELPIVSRKVAKILLLEAARVSEPEAELRCQRAPFPVRKARQEKELPRVSRKQRKTLLSEVAKASGPEARSKLQCQRVGDVSKAEESCSNPYVASWASVKSAKTLLAWPYWKRRALSDLPLGMDRLIPFESRS